MSVSGQNHAVLTVMALEWSLNSDIVTPVFFLLMITLAVFSLFLRFFFLVL